MTGATDCLNLPHDKATSLSARPGFFKEGYEGTAGADTAGRCGLAGPEATVVAGDDEVEQPDTAPEAAIATTAGHTMARRGTARGFKPAPIRR